MHFYKLEAIPEPGLSSLLELLKISKIEEAKPNAAKCLWERLGNLKKSIIEQFKRKYPQYRYFYFKTLLDNIAPNQVTEIVNMRFPVRSSYVLT